MEFLTSTPFRIAAAAVGTAAVATGSYLIGVQHGVEEATAMFQEMLPDIVKDAIAAANAAEENVN